MKSLFLIFLSTIGLVLLITIIEAFIALRGTNENFPRPHRETNIYGEGKKKLNYLMLGDSTAAGQGAEYQDGIALRTVDHLKKGRQIIFINTGVPGATTHDVLTDQLRLLENFKPDVVLISVGANDSVKLSNPWQVKKDIETIVQKIIAKNCEAKIVITGSPDVGSVKRLLFPLNWEVSGLGYLLNKIAFKPIIQQYNLTYAPLYEETGPIFRKDPTLLAEDLFHPNAEGYEVWAKVLNKSLDQALKNQPNHCK